MTQFKYLFSPIEIGSMSVMNRVVVPGHYPALREPDTLTGERITAYWESKARGGAGMISTGIWGVHDSSPTPSRLGYEFRKNQVTSLQMPEGIDKLRRTAETIQQHGTKFLVQLWHGGSNAYGTTAYGDQLWAPSAIRAAGSGHVTHAMTKSEIQELVEAFAAEALRAKQAGVDGVEVHGAHGYLITQFMSPLTNHRDDEYGGDHEGRIRFACEIIDAVRAAVGSDFGLGIRISADPISGGGYTIEDTKIYSQMLTKTGNLDYIATGAGIPPTYIPLGALMYHAAAIKEVVDIPVIGGGRINDPVQAEQILEDHQADLLFMNRALICDPEMPNKAREGRLEEIRHCMGCSEGCWMRVSQEQNSQGVSCAYNPTVGRETIPGWLEMIPAEKKKKVMVIGGGPGGLEVARVTKSRGHDVSLWEQGDELGGLTLLAAKLPGREDLSELTRYYNHQMKMLDVDIHLNSKVTIDVIREVNPDAIVVATGSTPMVPKVPGIDQDNVITNVRDVILGKAEVGQNVLIVDNQRHMEGLGTADFLSQQGKNVEVLFTLDAPATNMEEITKMFLRRRLSWGKVKLSSRGTLKAINGNTVTVTDVGLDEDREMNGFDTIILSYGGVENNNLLYAIKDQFPEVYGVGDCKGVRKILWAVHEAADVGRDI